MLFVLSKDLLPICEGSSGTELEGLQNLLLSARRGQHAISGPFKNFSALSKNPALSARERATALGLANRRTELPILEREVRAKIFVNSKASKFSRKRINNSEWQIVASDLTTKFLASTVVLAENMIDAEIYQHAGQHYRAHKKINGITLRSSARGGGGSQIDVEFNSILQDGVPVIAITDGDLTFPKTSKSVISDRCDSLVDSEVGIGWHFSLPCRDIENIIPPSLLLTVADPQVARDAHSSLTDLIDIAEKINSKPCNFICMKRGQTLNQVFNHINIAERDYWLRVAKAIKFKKHQAFHSCLDDMSCNASPCKCVITIGFGDGILAQVKKWLEENSLHEALKTFSSNEDWMKIGSMIFDASIAFKAEKI